MEQTHTADMRFYILPFCHDDWMTSDKKAWSKIPFFLHA